MNREFASFLGFGGLLSNFGLVGGLVWVFFVVVVVLVFWFFGGFFWVLFWFSFVLFFFCTIVNAFKVLFGISF